MKIHSSHERVIAASLAQVARLVHDFDAIWPRQLAPPPRPAGRRLYEVPPMRWEEIERPGAVRAFRVVHPEQLRAQHWFELHPVEGGTLVRHTVDGEAAAPYDAIWRLKILPLHDRILEALLDNLESAVRTTRVTRRVNAPRAKVYRALIDRDAVARWKVPAGMTCEVHAFVGREGGTFRISLTYVGPGGRGKTSSRTDTYRGRFVELVPDQRVVEIDEFETSDPALQGEMRIEINLMDIAGGTEVVAVHEGLPRGLSRDDNEVGWGEALGRLAQLVEQDEG